MQDSTCGIRWSFSASRDPYERLELLVLTRPARQFRPQATAEKTPPQRQRELCDRFHGSASLGLHDIPVSVFLYY